MGMQKWNKGMRFRKSAPNLVHEQDHNAAMKNRFYANIRTGIPHVTEDDAGTVPRRLRGTSGDSSHTTHKKNTLPMRFHGLASGLENGLPQTVPSTPLLCGSECKAIERRWRVASEERLTPSTHTRDMQRFCGTEPPQFPFDHKGAATMDFEDAAGQPGAAGQRSRSAGVTCRGRGRGSDAAGASPSASKGPARTPTYHERYSLNVLSTSLPTSAHVSPRPAPFERTEAAISPKDQAPEPNSFVYNALVTKFPGNPHAPRVGPRKPPANSGASTSPVTPNVRYDSRPIPVTNRRGLQVSTFGPGQSPLAPGKMQLDTCRYHHEKPDALLENPVDKQDVPKPAARSAASLHSAATDHRRAWPGRHVNVSKEQRVDRAVASAPMMRSSSFPTVNGPSVRQVHPHSTEELYHPGNNDNHMTREARAQLTVRNV